MVVFNKAIFVDRLNQNITTAWRRTGRKWVVRSMNPSTTGLHRPPYAQETPLGMFVLQEKESENDISERRLERDRRLRALRQPLHGRSLHSRSTLSTSPEKTQIEYSWSLGNHSPDHICVRNATSHAKFIYDWAPVNETIIFVLE